MATAFFNDETTFWHSTGVQSLFFPIGGWVEPPSGTYAADTPASKRRILNLIQASGLAKKLVFPPTHHASREQLLTVHTEAYLNKFKELSDSGGGDLGSLAPFSSGGYEIATKSAGLAINAVEDVLGGEFENAFALCRPSGHHCTADTPMAFCLLANTAIAVEVARRRSKGLRVAIIDWDVHFANGTQDVFYENSDVLTISIHQEGCRPPGQQGGEITERGKGLGLGTNLNIPLPPGSGHEAYLYAFSKLVIPQVQAFKPDLIVVSSGLDASAVDPLSRMLLHSNSFRELTELTKQLAENLCDGKLVVIHEGGYSEAYAPFCGLAIVEALAGVRSAAEDPALAIFETWQPSLRFNGFLRSIIDEYAAAIGTP